MNDTENSIGIQVKYNVLKNPNVELDYIELNPFLR